MRLQLPEEGASEALAVRQVEQLHDGEALKQVREARICDVPLWSQILHGVGAHHVVELWTDTWCRGLHSERHDHHRKVSGLEVLGV